MDFVARRKLMLSCQDSPSWLYIGKICDDCNSYSSLKCQKPSSKTIDGIELQLVLVDDTNGVQCSCCNIRSSSTLKILFNSYAEQQGISLRSLRLSHKGKTLFLSSVGNKTPDELYMQNKDRIHVRVSQAYPKNQTAVAPTKWIHRQPKIKAIPELPKKGKFKVQEGSFQTPSACDDSRRMQSAAF